MNIESLRRNNHTQETSTNSSNLPAFDNTNNNNPYELIDVSEHGV